MENQDKLIIDIIRRVSSYEEGGAILLTSMPLCGITGTQYDKIVRTLHEEDIAVIEVPGDSLRLDWLDGYGKTLSVVANELDLSNDRGSDDCVAIVGHLMDRNEGDHIGNFSEFKRMLKAISLDLVSIWPDGHSFNDLRLIERAGTIISFPYARKAADTISKKIGARLVQTDVPFGLSDTVRWIRTVGDAFGRERQAEESIDRELKQIVPIIQRILPFYFLNRKAFLSIDPHLLPGCTRLLTELGFAIETVVVTGRINHIRNNLDSALPDNLPIFYEPMESEVADHVADRQQIDLSISNGELTTLFGHDHTWMEFGFPSYHYHAFSSMPFLGFGGALHFIHRMANTMARLHD
jgi:nitrogenase molybdenum-iron protein alpha/beta subunit